MTSHLDKQKIVNKQQKEDILKKTSTDLLEISEVAHEDVSKTLYDSEDKVSSQVPSEES
jgi:hypothetical protein